MARNLESLLEDENFSVQTGVIPARATISGADLGPGIIYYPANVNLTHRLGDAIESVGSRRLFSTATNVLWNTGRSSEIFNPEGSAAPFIRVGLRPSDEAIADMPEELLGVVSAALVQDEWAEPFKQSVREDLDAIRAFAEPLRQGQAPTPENREAALLAKEDLDVKLLWATGEFAMRGLLTPNYINFAVAASTPATGMINVTANTKDQSGSPVSTCIVWYVKWIWHKNPGPYKTRFLKASTPTNAEPIAVGNYDMWAEKAGANGPNGKIAISSASASQSVDLLAP